MSLIIGVCLNVAPLGFANTQTAIEHANFLCNDSLNATDGALLEEEISAIQCLGKSQSEGALLSLAHILKEGPRQLAVPAARALGEKGDVRAIPHLIAVLDLVVLDGRTYEAKKVLEKYGAAALPDLLHALRVKKRFRRNDVIYLLGRINNAKALNALGNVLLNHGPRESKNACIAMKNHGEASIPIFLEALNSKNDHVRKNGLIGLGNVDWPDNNSYLSEVLPLLGDRVISVRLEATSVVMAKKSVSALPELKQALEVEKDAKVKARMSKAIKRLHALQMKK